MGLVASESRGVVVGRKEGLSFFLVFFIKCAHLTQRSFSAVRNTLKMMSKKAKSGFQKRKQRQEREKKKGNEGKQLLTNFFPKKGEPKCESK